MKSDRPGADIPAEVTVANLENPRMDVAEVKMTAIRDQVQSGDYRVDTQAVADAILRRLLSASSAMSPFRAQNECSYPDSAAS